MPGGFKTSKQINQTLRMYRTFTRECRDNWMDGLAGSSRDYQWIELRQVTDGLTVKLPTSSL
ncbi:hypothetical protein J6590_080295 [Homalodisca vitripennis]|nr:hypothetical protein J6590_080295 [Homalodisca vitripennis]